MNCFLRIGSDSLDEATQHDTIRSAVAEYSRVARDLARFGQAIDATIHIARTREELVEDADYCLSFDDERDSCVRTKL